MNYSLNVKSSSIVHTLLSTCVKLLRKVQKLLIQCINYSIISKRIRVVSPKSYTVRKNFTGPPVLAVPTNLKSGAWSVSLQLCWGKMYHLSKELSIWLPPEGRADNRRRAWTEKVWGCWRGLGGGLEQPGHWWSSSEGWICGNETNLRHNSCHCHCLPQT